MPSNLRIYLYAVIVGGMSLLPFSIFQIDSTSILFIVVIGIIAGLLDRFLIELPNGTFFSGTLAFTATTLIYIGIHEAILVEFIAFLISTPFFNRNWIKSLYNLSQYMLCTWVSGLILLLIGGQIGIFTFYDIPRILMIMASYQILNTAMLSVILSVLQKRRFTEVFIATIEDSFFGYISNAIIGVFLYYLYPLVNLTTFFITSLFIAITLLVLRYSFGLFIKLRKTYLATLEKITFLKEMKMNAVKEGHANRVGQIARELAERLKLSQEEVDNIHYAALLHDIGKDYLSESLFKKKSTRTLEEESENQRHVEIGAQMVQEIHGLTKTSNFILYHHEHWDGSGYPLGKKGDDIPLGARIISLANQYDHILSDNKILDKKKTFEKKAGTILDPTLVDLFVSYSAFSVDEHFVNNDNLQDTLLEKVVIEQTKKKFEESILLREFGDNINGKYTNGQFYDHLNQPIKIPAQPLVLQLIEQSNKTRNKVRDFIEDTESGKIFDVYCIPVDDGVHIMLFDVTHILEYEKDQEKRVRKLYRDVIYSATQGKLLIEDSDNVSDISGELLIEHKIKELHDVTQSRMEVQSVLEKENIPKKEAFSILLCLSEVTTNVLKHANDGCLKLYKEGNLLKIHVKDTGDGIKLEDLPKTTLLVGYSSRKSLGQGFNILLKFMERVILNTSSQGTTIILEKKLEQNEEKVLDKNNTVS
ncbi:HD domain-containing phosphohydrolase [Aquibacillus albus]|uniref:Nucleotidyltransferase with HDIG domain n=1 Tax=Aquibacillus albus TaxID=1168171 RepID=A0ABS2N5B8_9BACI|nr:HD domain-containing phosphohydrolase [Aquibacillus albus]MBM7573321.1 putative nucleotidyltransferase with HDIG domain [Aquibacillus albus]